MDGLRDHQIVPFNGTNPWLVPTKDKTTNGTTTTTPILLAHQPASQPVMLTTCLLLYVCVYGWLVVGL